METDVITIGSSGGAPKDDERRASAASFQGAAKQQGREASLLGRIGKGFRIWGQYRQWTTAN